MKNILLFYQPIADYTIKFLDYQSIYFLQHKGIYNSEYYKDIIYSTGYKDFQNWFYKTNRKYYNFFYQCDDELYINLSDSFIKKIPMSINILTDLKNLDLSYNKLKFLPENIVNLINLEGLLLRNNKLKRLLKHIGKLSKLKILNLIGNRNLKQLPDSIVNLTNLKHLLITGTVIFPIPMSPNFKPKITY